MDITPANLRTLYQSYSMAFNTGFTGVQSQWSMVAMRAPSSTESQTYPWLGQIPGMRKWVGDRVINEMKAHGFSITNEDFEDTISVDRNNIEDDTYGVFAPMFTMLGQATGTHVDELVWALLKNGTSALCYDGQPFFDTDHPVLDADGNPQSVSNFGGGAGTTWYLLDDMRPMKPIIFQDRKPANLIRKDREEDDNVFHRKQFLYGVDCRRNVGFGMWQVMYASKQPLTGENFAAAREAMSSMKGDYGRPLGMVGRKLIVPPSLETAANLVVKAEQIDGTSNIHKGMAEPVMVPWLA